MDAGLPGSSSGKSLGLGVFKAAVRLVGGSDLADAVADLTGLSRTTVKRLVRDAATALEEQAPDEFREVAPTAGRGAAEEVLTRAFTRAATAHKQGPGRVPVAALLGPVPLMELVVDEAARAELAELSHDERGYFHALTAAVTMLVCSWYVQDPNARGLATAVGVGQVLRDLLDHADALARIQEGVTDLQERSDAAAVADVVEASVRCSGAGVRVGDPVTGWAADKLGVHQSITVNDEAGLTPYLPRAHDVHLAGVLSRLREPGAGPVLVVVVGTSCVGKTRTLYEAVRDVLGDWPLVAPRDDTDLAAQLVAGVPAGTVVWLDELQDRLTLNPDGITAAKGILRLVDSDQVGPVLFAGTIWPANLTALVQRPSSQQSTAGAGAVPALLERAVTVEIPDVFTDHDIPTTGDPSGGDLRIRRALQTASHTGGGRRLAQVLAGGTRLVERMYPPSGVLTVDRFGPGAHAVLRAAGDLRRVGYPNPLPRWVVEGAAPGYLDPAARDRLDPSSWLVQALTEATQDAAGDNPATGPEAPLDVHGRGVPALTPTWTLGTDGVTVPGFELHDYLYQDHRTRHRHTPTAATVWDTLTRPDHLPTIDTPTLNALAVAAANRGLTTTAITFIRAPADTGNPSAQNRLVDLLAERGDDTALAELRTLADAGNELAQEWVTVQLARRGDDTALAELRARADAGDWFALARVTVQLARRGDDTALAELRARADAGDWFAQARLTGAVTERVDDTALAELRARADAGDWFAQARLAGAVAERADDTALAELRTRADTGDESAQARLADLLAERADDTALAELRARAAAGDGSASETLIHHVYRRQSTDNHVLELDIHANPVYAHTDHHPS